MGPPKDINIRYIVYCIFTRFLRTVYFRMMVGDH
jgi:hypothetical protein